MNRFGLTHSGLLILLRAFPLRGGLMLLAALAGYGLPMRDALASQPVVRIAVLAHRGEEAALKNWQATADYLTRAIPTHRFAIVPLMNATLGPMVAAQKVDFVLTNPGSYVSLESQYGVTRMLTMRSVRQGRTYTEFGAVIFARADRDDIRSLADLKGKSFMGVGKDTFGGFQMAQSELQNAGVDPFEDLARLEFVGLPQDTIVYAVRDARVDAGTVRTDILEGMAAEGKIDLARFKAIGARQHPDFPFMVSTRLYPEWAFARLRHVPEELAQQIAIALLSLPPDSPAASASQSAGWTVPLDYTPVHELFKELRTGPYENLGDVRLVDVLRQYWQWIAALISGLALLLVNILHILRLNCRLKEARLRLEASNVELQQISSHDGLTGVANRCSARGRTCRPEGADHRMPEEVEVADGVEDLVLHELVLVAQAVGFSTRYSSITIALSRLPPSASPCARMLSTSCMKPKVRARLTSFT
jgi:two-component system, LuxR family, sensor histidine kinase TtrS